MKKLIAIVLVLLAFSGFAANATDLFPDIKGWTMHEEERVYNSSDLWEIINGAAEGFISYGFVDLHMAEYSNGEQIVRVELYNQGSSENAYGMYTSERMPDYPGIEIGAQGYKSGGIINFFSGPYYVKIMTVGLSNVSEETIFSIAEQVDLNLGQSHEMPAIIALFPKEGMETLSDSYVSSSFMGYGFLRSAFTARYDAGGTKFQLFVISTTPAEAQIMIDRYKALLKEDKVEEKGGMTVFNDMFNGKVFISGKGGYLVGVLNTDNEEVAGNYINLVLQKLQ